MPNPFMRSVQVNTSDEAMAPDRPHPTDPILESYSGTNHPYRGIEQHGVADTESPDDPTPEWPNGTRTVVYAEPPKEPDPIPVKIVSESGQEIRGLAIEQSIIMGGTPTRIVHARRGRTKVTIRNTDPAKRIWIGVNESLVYYVGFPIDGNGSFDTSSEGDIWAIADDGASQVRVSVASEFSLDV